MATSACLSDDELAELVTTMGAADPRLPHVEACDACRAIWLHARDADTPTWTVGRYQVRGTLGVGGLGVVLLGWDPVLQREVAIKFPSSARGGMLLREAQALAAIRHRNVVAVHDFGEVDGDVYFAMERVEGVPFDTWWLAASTGERLRALIDVAEGLAAIHAAGLVHCDIKPANIIVTRATDVVIVDLGLATPHGDQLAPEELTAGSPGPGAGTPGFRAPEVEQGGPPTPASDEYAFWCVVRACLANARLGSRRRRRLDALIARGTSIDPTRRLGSMTACGAALRALGERRRWVVGAVALVISMAIAAMIAMIVVRGAAPTCGDELSGWSAAIRERVAQRLADRPDVRARVLAFIDSERATARKLLTRACEVNDDDASARATGLRTQWCVLSSWQWIVGHVDAIAGGRDIAHSLDELPRGISAERCAPGGVTASPPAVDASATKASRAVFAAIHATEGLPPEDRLRGLEALGTDVIAANNAGLLAAWHLERADAYQRVGKQREALEGALAAIDVATRNGDDLVLARARLSAYILRDVSDRTGATRDAEVEAIVTRVGSPGLLAHFQNAAGQRAIALGDIARAVPLFERAIETFAEIELAPSMMRGSSEQNLGVALQFSGKLDDAQVHFDRAVEVFTARFGATHDEAAGARLAAAHNRVYRGRVDDGARELATLSDELAASKRAHTALGARVAMARCQADQVLRARGTEADPLARCSDALATNRAVFGADNVEIVPPLLAVAQLTMATSVRDALPMLAEAVAIAENQAGNPTDLPYARGLFALALKATGKVADGHIVAQKAVGDLDRLGQRELAATLRTQFPTLPPAR